MDLLQGDDGLVRWFGDAWGAHVNEPQTHIPVPVGEPCAECGTQLTTSDQGVSIIEQRADDLPLMAARRIAFHLACFERMIGISREVNELQLAGIQPVVVSIGDLVQNAIRLVSLYISRGKIDPVLVVGDRLLVHQIVFEIAELCHVQLDALDTPVGSYFVSPEHRRLIEERRTRERGGQQEEAR